jgi:Ca2+-binding EF-hand superfamily protein
MFNKSITLTLARVAVIAGAGLFAASAVQAQGAMRDRQVEKLFKAADTNADGKLTLAEAQASKTGMPKVAANFDAIDTDKKGYVTLEQIKASANSAAATAKTGASSKAAAT